MAEIDVNFIDTETTTTNVEWIDTETTTTNVDWYPNADDLEGGNKGTGTWLRRRRRAKC